MRPASCPPLSSLLSGRFVLPALALLVLCSAQPSRSHADEPVARATAMARAAQGWLALLEPAQRRLAALPFDHPLRRRWQATPGTRVGLAWGALSPAQRAAAENLLRSGLSPSGLEKFRGVRTLEGILRVQAGAQVRRSPSWRDPGLYWIAVFGTPTPTGTWSWRVEGHHFSRHFTCVGGRVSCAPAFHGANPARSRQGLRVLAQEEDAARALLLSLDEKRRAAATLSVPARDFLPQAPRDLSRLPTGGVRADALSEAQRTLLWRLFDVYTASLHPDLQAEEKARARQANPEAIRFAWIGSSQARQSHGYRLSGPTFFFEYWQGGNHIHTVWRDPQNEYGSAWLRRAR